MLLVLQPVKPLKEVVPLKVATVTGCPVVSSVTVKLLVATPVTGPVTLLTSITLPPEFVPAASDTARIGVIVKVVVRPAVVPTKESATLNSIAMPVGCPGERGAAVANGSVTELVVNVGDSSQTSGVAPAVHEFGGVAESLSVEFGSTLTAAVAVPNVIRTAV